MKKYMLIGIMTAGLLMGCQNQSETQMTQPIVTAEIGSAADAEAASGTGTKTQTNTGAQSVSENGAGEGPSDHVQNSGKSTEGKTVENAVSSVLDAGSVYTGDIETDTENYYKVKAEKDAIDIDIDKLEASYRIGELDTESFRAQKQELKKQEDILDAQEEVLENAVDLAYYQSERNIPEGDIKSLLEQERELKTEENALEIEEEMLELSYKSGEISREEFIKKQTELIRREEALDRRDEEIELALELQGWDD